jgi:hypothetical protein
MASEEIQKENTELETNIKDCRARIAILKEQVQHLSTEYDTAKHYLVFQRVRLMKAMVKNAIEHPLVKDHFLARVSNLGYTSQQPNGNDGGRDYAS